MKRTFFAGLLGAFLAVAAPVAEAQQPARLPRELVSRQPAPTPPQRIDVVAPVDERSARDIRQRLNEILREYPPSLAQVLRLDPSLMTREDYLAPYPALALFIAQHPELSRDPAFYLGQPYGDNSGQEDSRARAIRAFGDVMSYFTLLGGFVAFFLLVGFLARLLVDHRRWLRATKTQTDTHTKLIDRLTSNDDLMAYIQSPAGQSLLQPAPVALDYRPRAIGAPVSRILWSVQAGVVLAAGGIGLWFARFNVIDEAAQPLYVVAILAVALGIGFVVSALLSFGLSRQLGLLNTHSNHA